MSNARPGLVALANIAQAQLVARHQAHLLVGLGQAEIGQPFLVEAKVPAHLNVALGLRLLQAAVVVGLHLDERCEYVLILVGVLVAQRHGRRLLVHAGPLEILKLSLRRLFPQVFEFVDLLRGNLTRAELLLLRGDLDEPREE